MAWVLYRTVVCILFVGKFACVNGVEEVKDETINGILADLKKLQSVVHELRENQKTLVGEIDNLKNQHKEQKALSKQCFHSMETLRNFVNHKLIGNGETKTVHTNIDSIQYSEQNKSAHTENQNQVRHEKQRNMDRRVSGDPENRPRVAFTAKAINEGNLGAHQTILFPNVVTNIGNQYNPQHSIFYCDIPGTYVFFVHLLNDVDKQVRNVLVKDGAEILYSYAARAPNAYGSASNMVILELQKGDSVWIENIDVENGSAVHAWSTFSGFLLYTE